MEERLVALLELGVLFLTLLNAGVGVLSVYWARSDSPSWRCRSGCILFSVNLVALGIAGVVAALARAQGLPPLGLVAGLLIVAMMWERPVAERERGNVLATRRVAES